VAWVVLQPLITSLIFAFVFDVLAHQPSEGRPYILFAFSGLLAWNAFSQMLNRVSFALVRNAHLVSKVYFPWRMRKTVASHGPREFLAASG
jgi:homopolymeric O-antigen transport system permease protein